MTIPTTPDVALPAAMIEAAARAWFAWFQVDQTVNEWDQLPPWDQDIYREAAARGLAAALGVCDVREERRTVTSKDDGATMVYPWVVTTHGGNLRRLVITTPAESDPSAGQS